MFVYLLIASELVVLYTVYWYLYVREPRVNRRISANMWGSYEQAADDQFVDPTLAFARHREGFENYSEAYASASSEYVLDPVTNHYVRVEQGDGLLGRISTDFDRQFSRLNVRA
jgi:hypothetical protein